MAEARAADELAVMVVLAEVLQILTVMVFIKEVTAHTAVVGLEAIAQIQQRTTAVAMAAMVAHTAVVAAVVAHVIPLAATVATVVHMAVAAVAGLERAPRFTDMEAQAEHTVAMVAMVVGRYLMATRGRCIALMVHPVSTRHQLMRFLFNIVARAQEGKEALWNMNLITIKEV